MAQNPYMAITNINKVGICSIQGKVVERSELLLTITGKQYFWCKIRDEQKLYNNKNDKHSNQIQLMFWYPFSIQYNSIIKKNNIYDIINCQIIKSQVSYRQFHTFQLHCNESTEIKSKEHLNVMKNGILCIKEEHKKKVSKKKKPKQINKLYKQHSINEFFKPKPNQSQSEKQKIHKKKSNKKKCNKKKSYQASMKHFI